MRIRLIPLIRKWWVALVAVVVLLPCAAVAGATAALEEQLRQAAAHGDVAQVKTLLKKGAAVNA